MANDSQGGPQDDIGNPAVAGGLNAEPNFDIEDEAGLAFVNEPSSALPVLVDANAGDYDDDDYDSLRKPIDLDLETGVSASSSSSNTLDLSALIGQFDAAKRAPTKSAQSPATTPDQVFDVSTPTVDQDAEIARLRSELSIERNNVLRAHADQINLRRKLEQDRERAVRDTSERVIKQLLPIIDDFERSVSATAQTKSYEQLLEGVEAILRNFTTLLDKHGVEAVPTVGVLFDPDIHEAVSVDETSDEPEDTIVEELRKGYRTENRLLRAALVKVVKYADSNGEVESPVEPVLLIGTEDEQVAS